MDTAPLADARPRGADLVVIHLLRAVALLAMVANTGLGAFALAMPLLQGAVGVPVIADVALPPARDLALAPAQSWVEAVVVVMDAPAQLVALVVGAHVVALVGWLAALGGIALLAHRMLRGAPFAASARASIGAVALGVLLLALIAPALRGLASVTAMPLLGDGYGAVSTVGLPAIVIALVALALMAAFRIAERMQRDVGGLV